MPPSAKLYYYKALGRGNQIRLTLAAAGWEWEEDHAAAYPPTPEEIANWREIGKNVTTNVPMLVVDVPEDDDDDNNDDGESKKNTSSTRVYCQSSAIIRAVGRMGDLMPTSDDDLYVMDKIIADAEDLRTLGYKSTVEFGASQETINEYIDTTLPKHLENFERQLGLTDGDYFVGSRITVADCTAYDAIVTFSANRVPGALDNYPNLQAWVKRIEDHPGIAKYHSSPLYESLYKFSVISKK